ncbi:phage tail protein [uncultured Pseudomonas sp.]|uniref:phage tail-collar fiber domain-containing protein n=1 Tax=uncultured Pseudomonas sp. TaxID=114707 RepID=UPI0025DF5B52|nr:phage tail protein [uncultured Pseudomonas sp.]
MGASITIAGERLIAQKQAARQPLQVARFVLAYLPGLDTTQPIDREAGLPPADQIVYIANLGHDMVPGPNGELTREGYLGPNQVVYSLLMGSSIGDFDFNWIGLQTTEDVLLIAAYVPRQQKRREREPLQTGNNLTRNIVLEYDGAQSLTGIEVPAASWQFDFTAQFAAMNTQIAALQAELEKKVDAASWNPPQSVSLDGPVLVYPGSSNTYQITDYDAFAVYQASSTAGQVTLSGDVLVLDVPIDEPPGLAALEVKRNDATAVFKVPVGSAAIERPTLVSPVDSATGVTFEPVLQAAAFTVYPASHDAHFETRWQVARDSAFTLLVLDQQGADKLTTFSLADAGVRLDPSTRYYARVQYHGATLVSAWSAPVAFNTTAVYVRRPAVTSPMDGAVNFTAASIKGDAFSVYGGADAHAASRWQISTVADFSTVLADSGWTASSLTSWTPPAALSPSTQYYARVQYRGASAGDSGWSPAVGFVTAAPLAGVYTARASGPSARRGGGMASVGGYIYVCGGWGAAAFSDVWRYDPAANSWKQMASMPAARGDGVGCTVHDGKIYVMGGLGPGTSDFLSSVFCYDPASNAWSTLQSMPVGLRFPVVVSIGAYIYVSGGERKEDARAVDLHRYDPAANAWIALAPRPLAVQTLGQGGAIAGRLHLIGVDGSHQAYSPDADTWSVLAPAPSTQAWAAVAVVSGLLYCHAGHGGTYPASDYRLLHEYDAASDTWRALPAGGPKIYHHEAAELDGSMYFFGGANPQNNNALVNWFYRID